MKAAGGASICSIPGVFISKKPVLLTKLAAAARAKKSSAALLHGDTALPQYRSIRQRSTLAARRLARPRAGATSCRPEGSGERERRHWQEGPAGHRRLPVRSARRDDGRPRRRHHDVEERAWPFCLREGAFDGVRSFQGVALFQC